MAEGSSDDQTHAAPRKGETFRPAVKFAAAALFVLLLVALVVLAEVGLRYASDFGAGPSPEKGPSPVIYSKEEQRRDLPHFTERQGSQCVEVRSGLNWDPRFGFASKKLDKECARKLFAAYPKSVVLLGGSAMENLQAPNYLTTIDSYAFGKDKTVASLNLAESGARHSNMLIRFLHEVIELHPDYAVFLDGFNEFNSVRYGGAPEDDFYWTAGVKDRVQNPLKFFRDKLIEKSRLAELIALKTGFINSARLPPSHVDAKLIDQAAEYYVKMRNYTQVMCEAYRIKCIFIIQPTALVENTPGASAKAVIRAHQMNFKADTEIYRTGYDYILRKAGSKVMDASHLFEGKDNVYLDVVHFNKVGSELIGKLIHSAVN